MAALQDAASAGNANQPTVHVGFLAAGNAKQFIGQGSRVMANFRAVTSAPIHFHVITDATSTHVRELLHAAGSQYSVHELSKLDRQIERSYRKLASTAQGYKAEVAELYIYKLFLHHLLPSSLERLVLVDLDMFANDDLLELWQQFDHFGPTNLLGVALEQQPSYFGCWSAVHGFASPQGFFWGFNGGLQLLHPGHMRESSEYNELLTKAEWFEAQKASIASRCKQPGGQAWNLGDQDLLSLMAAHGHHEWFRPILKSG